MFATKIPEKMGLGLLLGFCIPIGCILISTHTANSIDRPENRARALPEAEGESLPAFSAESLEGADPKDLKMREAEILARLGWESDHALQQNSKVPVTDGMGGRVEGNRAPEESQSGSSELAVAGNLQPDSAELVKASEENAALLELLVAEYEELERRAEALLVTGPDLKGTTSEEKEKKEEARQKTSEEALKDELKAQGLRVVGKGKQWLERRGQSAQKTKQSLNYNPHFGRLEFLEEERISG